MIDHRQVSQFVSAFCKIKINHVPVFRQNNQQEALGCIHRCSKFSRTRLALRQTGISCSESIPLRFRDFIAENVKLLL